MTSGREARVRFRGSLIEILQARLKSYRLSLCVLAGVLLSGTAGCALPSGYLAHVSDALSAAERGGTLDSIGRLREALGLDANHPLARIALGYTLLAGGKPDDAAREFQTALDANGTCAAAIYGKGLVALRRRQLSQALSYLCQAQSADPGRDMSGAIEYVKIVAGGRGTGAGGQGPGTDDEARLAVDAIELMQERRFADAAPIWEKLQQKAARPGIGERFGCTMSFVAGEPLAIRAELCKGTYKPFEAPKSKMKAVKGTVTLGADLSRARSVTMVTFVVDEKLVGITNCSPWQTSWNTTRWDNGLHTVRITGTDASGAEVSDKTTQVMVANPNPTQGPGPLMDDDSAAAWERLWGLMRLKPSAAAINHNMALCALATGDSEKAMAALERAVAANPGYLDAAERLQKLCATSARPSDLFTVRTGRKALALTFDDGPKPDTAKLLDALKEKSVKATFFVVGKQVEKYPELLKRMCDEGHEVQNHTYSHRDLETASTAEIEQEIFGSMAVVRSVTGRRMSMLRPPGAHRGKVLDEVTRRFGIRTVMYSANSSKLEGTTPDRIYKYVVSSAKPGAVVLLHNMDRVTLAALPSIIDTLRNKGYEITTLSELVAYAGRTRK